MTAPTAKELLAQADRLMRRREPGAPEELPVLTDLVVEEIEMPSLEFSFDTPPPVAPLPKVASAPAPIPAKVSPPAPEIDYVTLDEMIAPVAVPAAAAAAAAPLEPALTGDASPSSVTSARTRSRTCARCHSRRFGHAASGAAGCRSQCARAIQRANRGQA